jgi:hypothetical protein
VLAGGRCYIGGILVLARRGPATETASAVLKTDAEVSPANVLTVEAAAADGHIGIYKFAHNTFAHGAQLSSFAAGGLWHDHDRDRDRDHDYDQVDDANANGNANVEDDLDVWPLPISLSAPPPSPSHRLSVPAPRN